MSGKSTYMRQLAIDGGYGPASSYVPAESAAYLRCYLAVSEQQMTVSGQSTFMVEMMANNAIFTHATRTHDSLLDELGRGTATYDGMALAQSIFEPFMNISEPRPSLTHYHEVDQSGSVLEHLVNVHVAAAEQNGQVTFLHKIELDQLTNPTVSHTLLKIAGLPEGA